MSKSFYKYQGTGNDFVVLDGRVWGNSPDIDWIQRICHRKWGVGSDGLVIVSLEEGVDFRVDFFNPDGSQSFCGNGSRCAVDFFCRHFDSRKKEFVFSAIDGLHKGRWSDHSVSISMRDTGAASATHWGCFLNTGSPHVVVEVSDLKNTDVKKIGAEIRYAEEFKSINGTNVNFIEKTDSLWHLRTYERGVEDETLSCGTGVTAAALYILEKEQRSGQVNLQAVGGLLQVSATRKGNYDFTDVYLSGSVQKVFEGQWSN